MEKRLSTAGKNPKISLDVKGDLQLKGWEEQEVVVQCSSEQDLSLQQDGDEIRIACRGNCNVKVPYAARLEVENVAGNAAFKSLDGEMTIEQVSGNLTLRSTGPVAIARVRGNLVARNISGDLKVDSMDANVTVRDVRGDFIVADEVRGNLKMDDIDGDASARARGNITVRLDPCPGNTYAFEADGNLVCRIPTDTSAAVSIPEASKISINLPGVERSHPEAPFSLTMGEADAKLSLSARGNVILGSQVGGWGFEDFDLGFTEDLEGFDRIADQISQQIEAQMEMLEDSLESQLEGLSTAFSESGISPEKADQIAERTRFASQRAQEKMQRAQEKLQRKLEAARRRAEKRARSAERAARDRRKRSETFEWTPPEPRPKTEPITDEERLMILQMLEQGKISMEEAEHLLAALEGKEA
jgi:hypothetical protein